MGSPTGDLIALLQALLDDQRQMRELLAAWRDAGSKMDDFSRIRALADRQQKVLAHAQRLMDAKAEKIIDADMPLKEKPNEAERELRKARRDLREAKDRIRELDDVIARQRRAIEAARSGQTPQSHPAPGVDDDLACALLIVAARLGRGRFGTRRGLVEEVRWDRGLGRIVEDLGGQFPFRADPALDARFQVHAGQRVQFTIELRDDGSLWAIDLRPEAALEASIRRPARPRPKTDGGASDAPHGGRVHDRPHGQDRPRPPQVDGRSPGKFSKGPGGPHRDRPPFESDRPDRGPRTGPGGPRDGSRGPRRGPGSGNGPRHGSRP